MGIIRELKSGWSIESREKSVIFYDKENTLFEVDYKELDFLFDAVTEAQKNRRDGELRYYCVICRSNPVDADGGYDTCGYCLEQERK